MRRIRFVVAIACVSSIAVLSIRSSSISQQVLPDEISDQQYALLADVETFPAERLEEIRALLRDDGKISPAELRSLHIAAAAPESAKQQLLKRLKPKSLSGILLHPDESQLVTNFSPAICGQPAPRMATEEFEVNGDVYQLRDFHFCGSRRISGFSLTCNTMEANRVRHFGHSTAEVFTNNGFPCLFRDDLTSEQAYELLESFYDGELSDRAFFEAVIRPQ